MDKISACIIAHNEEKTIKRCFDSIKGVVDEIIVVHDGKCTDNTLRIAKRFNAKIFTRPHIGEAEPHRPFSFSKAMGSWILKIDPDEYLSEKAQKNLRKLTENSNIDAYAFLWKLYYKNRFTSLPGSKYKLCLFRKSKASMEGLVHEEPKIKGRRVNISLELMHVQSKDSLSLKYFPAKLFGWAKIDAKIRIQKGKAKNSPIFYLINAFIKFILYLGYSIIKGFPFRGYLGIYSMIYVCSYNFLLNYYIFQLKIPPLKERRDF